MIKLSLVSLEQAWKDKRKNLELCTKYIQKASKDKVELIIFPEMTLTSFSFDDSLLVEKMENSNTVENFSNLARKYNIAIVFGVILKDNERASNKAIFVDKNGDVKGVYTKIHPFSLSGEGSYLSAGKELSIVIFKGISIGITICYDLRFPEIYSKLATECDLIINIANWPSKRVDHWNTLLKARAIENQIFMAGVNRVGVDGKGLRYTESSNIFNANGKKLNFYQFKNMKTYEIDKIWTENFIKEFNTTNDRRVKLYKEMF